MLRTGRPVVPHFEPTEPLYYRCTSDHIVGQHLSRMAIKFPNISVNRGGSPGSHVFGPPEDVLIPDWLDWGIAEFKVMEIPTPLRPDDPQGAQYEFKVSHEPEEENYSHSEIRTYKNGRYSPKAKVSDKVKSEFLSQKTRIIRMPKK